MHTWSRCPIPAPAAPYTHRVRHSPAVHPPYAALTPPPAYRYVPVQGFVEAGPAPSGSGATPTPASDAAFRPPPSGTWTFADVRDVARAHVLAAVTHGSAGRRYIVSQGRSTSARTVTDVLKVSGARSNGEGEAGDADGRYVLMVHGDGRYVGRRRDQGGVGTWEGVGEGGRKEGAGRNCCCPAWLRTCLGEQGCPPRRSAQTQQRAWACTAS